MPRKSSQKPTKRRRGPGRPRAGERIPEGSRARLLDAAVEVFASRGYERATIDEIAAAAELSKGTVYWHFSSKAELFSALLEERVDRPVDTVLGITRTAPREQATAPAISAGFAALFGEHPGTIQLMREYAAAAARDPAMRERYLARQAKLRAAVAETLRIRQEKLGVPFALPPEQLATAFLALGFGLAMEAQLDPDNVPPELLGEILALTYEGNAARFGHLPEPLDPDPPRFL